MGIQISRSDFRPKFLYLCRVSFLTTLYLYKAYFRGRHIREWKENICKRWPMPYSLKKKLLCLCSLGFCNQVFLDLHCWWNEEFCSQQSSSSWWLSRVLGSAQLVSHTGIRASKGGVHILKSSEVLNRYKVSVVSSSTRIVKSRNNGFVLDLKLLFTIVDCLSGRFLPGFLLWNWLVSLVFLGYHILSYLFFRCMILTWYWCLFVLKSFINNKTN